MISVAVANSFKPHIATYTKAAEIMGVKMDAVFSSQPTPSIASGPSPRACIRHSSTVASCPSATARISRTLLRRI